MPGQLRPEARPALWSELDCEQRRAFKRIVRMIAEAVDDLPLCSNRGPALPGSTGEAASLAKSRTAFLSGERGTGKTTVLESIKRYTSAPSYDQLAAEIKGKGSTGESGPNCNEDEKEGREFFSCLRLHREP